MEKKKAHTKSFIIHHLNTQNVRNKNGISIYSKL